MGPNMTFLLVELSHVALIMTLWNNITDLSSFSHAVHISTVLLINTRLLEDDLFNITEINKHFLHTYHLVWIWTAILFYDEDQ